mgnify:FL=1
MKENWLSFTAGLSLVFAYAPFSLWWLPFVILPLWLNLIKDKTPGKAAKLGFLFAFGWFSSGISWVHVSIDEFGGMPLLVSLLLMLILCLYLAIYPALSCFLSARFARGRTLSLWLLPAFWLVCEYLRGTILTGFPWLSLGYSQIDGPLSVFAPVIGESGITLLLLVLTVCLAKLLEKQHIKRHIGLIAGTIAITFVLSKVIWVETQDSQIKVALVQGNIKQSLKWQPEQEWPTMLKYLDLTRVNHDAEIIIWPESAVPSIEPIAQDYLDMVNRSAALNNSSIITGILNYNFESKQYFNRLIVLGKKYQEDKEGAYSYGSGNHYDKHHLLPIGEFVPLEDWLRPIAPLFNLPQSSFSRGDYRQQNLIAQDLNLLPLICFEVAFPEQLAANFTEQTDLLLTVSNDAWFGNSHGPHQHMEIARMRALEFGRPILRSTNNGITAVTDHRGKIISQVPQFEEAVLKTEVQLVTGQTPFSQWGWLLRWLLPLLFFICYVLAAPRKNNSNQP